MKRSGEFEDIMARRRRLADTETFGNGKLQDTELTLENIAKHNEASDAWIIIDNFVYDVTKFLNTEWHPGGQVILTQAGKDCTDVFHAYHPAYVVKRKLVKYKVGPVQDAPETPQMTKEWRALCKACQDGGLYEPSYLGVAWMFIYPLIFLLLGIHIFLSGFEHPAMYVLGGALVGLAQHQWAFVGHDGSHGSLLQSWSTDFLLSIVGATLGFGVSSSWWKYTHNQHHIVTMEHDRDTDITHLPFFAVSKHMLLSRSKGTAMGEWTHRLARCMVRVQAFTFFPIFLLIARASLMINTMVMMFVTDKVPSMPWQQFHMPQKWKWADRTACLGHLAWVYVVFAHIVPEGHRFAAFLAQWLVVSFLHVQLVGNHWDRPAKFSADEEDTFFVKQIVTSRNYESGTLFNWLHGGLHFQIEHHLFPRMPLHSLERCRDEFVRPFAAKWGIPYSSTGFLHATYDVWRTLANVGDCAFDAKYD